MILLHRMTRWFRFPVYQYQMPLFSAKCQTLKVVQTLKPVLALTLTTRPWSPLADTNNGGTNLIIYQLTHIWELIKKSPKTTDFNNSSRIIFVFLIIWMLQEVMDATVVHRAIPPYLALKGNRGTSEYLDLGEDSCNVCYVFSILDKSFIPLFVSKLRFSYWVV